MSSKKGKGGGDADMTPAGKRTKAKLEQMMNQFDDFEGVMKEGTRVRACAWCGAVRPFVCAWWLARGLRVCAWSGRPPTPVPGVHCARTHRVAHVCPYACTLTATTGKGRAPVGAAEAGHGDA